MSEIPPVRVIVCGAATWGEPETIRRELTKYVEGIIGEDAERRVTIFHDDAAAIGGVVRQWMVAYESNPSVRAAECRQAHLGSDADRRKSWDRLVGLHADQALAFGLPDSYLLLSLTTRTRTPVRILHGRQRGRKRRITEIIHLDVPSS